MEIVKRQRGRNIPFYFTITSKEYIEMKKADCEIDGKESADRRAAWHRQKKSRSRDWHHEERQKKYVKYILNQNRRFVKWTY